MQAFLLTVIGFIALIVSGCAGQGSGLPLTDAAMARGAATSLPPARAPAAPPAATVSVDAAVDELRAALAREVPARVVMIAPDGPAWIERAAAMITRSGQTIDHAQLIVVVDRARSVQAMQILLARPDAPWQIIGGSRVSTGQAGRRGYFITPTGVFVHGAGVVDYRALGTFNENHIRGLGVAGMRVWDLGWQRAEKGWTRDGETADIRLLMHATDPVLEPRLGRPASMGCVRIPAPMNRFLDLHGVLDADQERATRTDPRWLGVLRPDRTPTPLAGNLLVVVDSTGTN